MKTIRLMAMAGIVALTLSLQVASQAQTIADGSFEAAGEIIGNGNGFLPYPTFASGWTCVDTDGEVFNDGNALDGDWYADLLQNGGNNPIMFWNEQSHLFGGYDRILTNLTDLTPNTDYALIFYHSTQLNRFGYVADQTLVQIQSEQSFDGSTHIFDTPSTNEWTPDTVHFTTDNNTTSTFLLFSPLGPGNASVSIDKISIINTTTTGIESTSRTSAFLVYPNPTTSDITVTNLHGIKTIELYNITGQRVFQSGNLLTDRLNVSLKHLPAGIYSLLLSDSSGGVCVKKVIKN